MTVPRYTNRALSAQAILFIRTYLIARGEELAIQTYKRYPSKRPLLLRSDEEAWVTFLELAEPQVKEYGSNIRLAAKRFLYEAAKKYTYIRYALATILPEIATLAFLGQPPDTTWGRPPVLKPSTWINKAFLTYRYRSGKIEANIFQRFFSTLVSPYLFMSNKDGKLLEKYTPALLRIYRRSYTKYLEAGRRPPHARRLANRDVVRVIIGNVWLIATLDALAKGVISPEDVLLPYHLAKDPALLHDMLDPAETVATHRASEDLVEELRKYTWRKLYKVVTGSEN